MKKYIGFLIVIIISVIPLLFTTLIPYANATRLYIDTPSYSQSMSGYIPKNYVISLVEGNSYTIKVTVDQFWYMDVGIRIGDFPYMISGKEVDSVSYTGEIMNYVPSRSGDHYIQLVTPRSGIMMSSSGFYDITIESGITASPTATMTDFFNGIYLVALILPTTLIALIGFLIVFLIIRRNASYQRRTPQASPYIYQPKIQEKPKKQMVPDKIKFCQFCGTELKQAVKYCPNCNMLLD